jgi:uncharacterized membrane protein YqgA involved in biofilm formation
VIPGLGTVLNTGTVLVGGTIGLTLGRFIPQSLQTTIRQVLGLLVIVIGVSMALKSQNPIVLLVSVLGGAVIGELLRLDDGLQALGRWAESQTSRGGGGRVSLAFVTTSLLFCVGPLTILGTFQDGAHGDISLLAIKSMLDGFAAVVFAATLGWGVLLSAVTVIVVQGALTLLAYLAHAGLSSAQTAELTGVGGVAVLGIALGLLEIKRIKVANLLPGLVLAPLLVAVLHAMGVL